MLSRCLDSKPPFRLTMPTDTNRRTGAGETLKGDFDHVWFGSICFKE